MLEQQRRLMLTLQVLDLMLFCLSQLSTEIKMLELMLKWDIANSLWSILLGLKEHQSLTTEEWGFKKVQTLTNLCLLLETVSTCSTRITQRIKLTTFHTEIQSWQESWKILLEEMHEQSWLHASVQLILLMKRQQTHLSMRLEPKTLKQKSEEMCLMQLFKSQSTIKSLMIWGVRFFNLKMILPTKI